MKDRSWGPTENRIGIWWPKRMYSGEATSTDTTKHTYRKPFNNFNNYSFIQEVHSSLYSCIRDTFINTHFKV